MSRRWRFAARCILAALTAAVPAGCGGGGGSGDPTGADSVDLVPDVPGPADPAGETVADASPPADAWADACPGTAADPGPDPAAPPPGPRSVPWEERFEGLALLGQAGWSVVDEGTEARCHWRLEAGTDGGLGPDGHVVFDPGAGTPAVRSLLVSPVLDASACATAGFDPLGVATLQWRMIYRHADPGAPVTLRVAAFAGDDPTGATVLWQSRTVADLAYDLHSTQLPDVLKFAPDLHVAFGVDTEGGITAAVGSLQVDDVVLACHRPNVVLGSRVYRCPDDDTPCTPANGTPVATGEPPSPVPDLAVESCGRYGVYLCAGDPDARGFTWQFYGFPALLLDAPPSAAPGFLVPRRAIGQDGGGCETAGFAVEALCGTPVADPGYFYCAADLDVPCDTAAGQAWTAGVVLRDHGDPRGSSIGALESLTRFRIEVASPPP